MQKEKCFLISGSLIYFKKAEILGSHDMGTAGWVQSREWCLMALDRAAWGQSGCLGKPLTLTLPFFADAAKLLTLCLSLIASNRVSACS